MVGSDVTDIKETLWDQADVLQKITNNGNEVLKTVSETNEDVKLILSNSIQNGQGIAEVFKEVTRLSDRCNLQDDLKSDIGRVLKKLGNLPDRKFLVIAALANLDGDDESIIRFVGKTIGDGIEGVLSRVGRLEKKDVVQYY